MERELEGLKDRKIEGDGDDGARGIEREKGSKN